MATLFEFLLVGDDEEFLTTVGEYALDRVTHIEQMISLFDPTSELARLNREAFRYPMIVTHELFGILADCHRHHETTKGYFDPCHGGPVRYGEAVQIDHSTRRISYTHPETRIDLGGYGKGVALDDAHGLLQFIGLSNYLLHGGTSSVRVDGEWRINLRSPKNQEVIASVLLKNESLSCSANDGVGTVVMSESASAAEAWSTALLCAGVERIGDFVYDHVYSAAWIDSDIQWIVGKR
jgi:thiamine biosynthesis lipoprotein ApbE